MHCSQRDMNKPIVALSPYGTGRGKKTVRPAGYGTVRCIRQRVPVTVVRMLDADSCVKDVHVRRVISALR